MPADFQHITDQAGLEAFCKQTANARLIGFDTEFVSENRYQPELCLLQVAADEALAIIDTLAINDISPFWERLTTGNHVTIAHAAREEFLFCFRDCGRRPKNLFDVQLAAGMIGLDHPVAYGNLVSKVLNQHVDKGETRTDWKRRPLSERQIAYALSDVEHLGAIYQSLHQKLEHLGRVAWFEDEMNAWQDALEQSEVEPQWRRVSGIANLNRRALAIIQELWIARDEEARRKNRAPRRILADDLIVELAKRGTSDIKRLQAIRGFDNRVSKLMFEPISRAIEKANSIPDNQLPERMPRNKSMNLGLLGQFLTTALHIVCREQQIAPSIVGTANDIRSLAAWRLGLIQLDQKPEMVSGWRAELVGQLVEQVLDGTIAIRVDDPHSDQPLKLEYLSSPPSANPDK